MSVKLFAVVLDCADAAGLARFWAEVLGRPVDEDASEDYAGIGVAAGSDGGGSAWMFIKVPEAKGPKNRVHVDLAATDLAAEVARITGLGARRLADQQDGDTRWVTLADPEGNEFDLVAAGS